MSHFVQVGELARPGGRRAGGFLPHDQSLRRFPIARHDERKRRGQHAARAPWSPTTSLRCDHATRISSRGVSDVAAWFRSIDNSRSVGGASVRARGASLAQCGRGARAENPLLERSSRRPAAACEPCGAINRAHAAESPHVDFFATSSCPATLFAPRQPMFEKSAEAEARVARRCAGGGPTRVRRMRELGARLGSRCVRRRRRDAWPQRNRSNHR